MFVLFHGLVSGWVSTLSAGSGGGATGFDFFEVSVDLSEEGNINKILKFKI